MIAKASAYRDSNRPVQHQHTYACADEPNDQWIKSQQPNLVHVQECLSGRGCQYRPSSGQSDRLTRPTRQIANTTRARGLMPKLFRRWRRYDRPMVADDGATNFSKISPDRRRAFWVSFGVVSVALAVVAVIEYAATLAGSSVPSNARAVGRLAGILGSPLIVYASAIPFVWGVNRRMVSAELKFPEAFRVPIVVGDVTARSSKVLAGLFDSTAVRLRNKSYATLAIDSLGVHVLKWSGRSPGLIPVTAVAVGGFANTPMGSRSLPAIVLRVHVKDKEVELPIVPMRLRGNPLRRLQRDELESVHAKITSALAGATVESGPNWPF